MRTGQTGGFAGFVADDRTRARHPPIRAVFMAQPVSKGECRRVPGSHGLDLAHQLSAVVGMDSLEPLVGRAADVMLVTADKGDPAGREMNPIGLQIPVPQTLAVDTSGLPTAGVCNRTTLIHGLRW